MLTGMEDVARAQNPQEAAMAALPFLIPELKGFVPAAKGKSPELFHQIGGGVKLSRAPYSQLTSTTVPTPGSTMLPDKPWSPEDFKLGSWLLPLYGDRTRAGVTLTDVHGVPLTTPQPLGGGGRFMQENPGRLWASEQGKGTAVSKKVQQLEQESGLPVYATHVSMGPAGSDFAKMTTRPLLQMTKQQEIPDALARSFDDRMAAAGVTNWPGIKNVNMDEWLATASGGARQKVAETMQLSPFQNNPAFANVAATRKALTEPELVDMPMLTTGMTVGQFAPGGQMAPGAGTHETYSTDWLGRHLGNMGQVPASLMFQDYLENFLTKNPKLRTNIPTIGYAMERQMPAQKINQQWLDNIMPWWQNRGNVP
jgi:hypothetical protein